MRAALSLDGGGIRGILGARTATEIEQRSGKSLSEIFDLFSGTSIGGLGCITFTIEGEDGKPKYEAEDYLRMLLNESETIFNRSLIKVISSVDSIEDEKYDAKGLEEVLDRYLGETEFTELMNNVLVTSYDTIRRSPVLFKSWKDREIKNRIVARATTAAPTYFESLAYTENNVTQNLVDGGITANNPAELADTEIKKLFPGEEYFIFSVGTGKNTRPYYPFQTHDWGKREWAGPALSMMFDASSNLVDYKLKMDLGDRYRRLQVDLKNANDDLDDVSPENRKKLLKEAERMIKIHSRDIDYVVDYASSV